MRRRNGARSMTSFRKVDCVNQTERGALHRPWARARCMRVWMSVMFDCTPWGGRGYCSIARNVRTAAACVCTCMCVCVCVTLMDAPMERRTDAWADLTACSGGAAHIVPARLRRKHPRSAESHQSPILPPSPVNGRGTDRQTGLPVRRYGERGWGDPIPSADAAKRAVSSAIDERERRDAAAPHLAQRKTGGDRETAFGNSPLELSRVLPFPLRESFILCFHRCERTRSALRIA